MPGKNSKLRENTRRKLERRIRSLIDIITEFKTPKLTERQAAVIEDLRAINRSIAGLGMAYKEVRGRPTGTLALVFYVVAKRPKSELRGSEVVPPVVPMEISGGLLIPTDVVPVGIIRPEVLATRNPVQPGYSICEDLPDAYGTLGAIVTPGKSGECLLLSCSHVFAHSGTGKRGDPIVYPGPGDGGTLPADKVGTLLRWVPFKLGGAQVNTVDCAVARPLARRLGQIRADVVLVGLPAGTKVARLGMKVQKVGRATGRTRSKVRDPNFAPRIDYGPGVGVVGFRNQILCNRYTDEGDSGALVMDLKRNAVGLHFAGSKNPPISVANPIRDVLRQLKVVLATKQVHCKKGSSGVTRGGG